MHNVHSIIALSVLESVQAHDAMPDGEGPMNASEEAVKLGRTSTITSQIERYSRLANSNGYVTSDVVAALFKLVSRRTDADLLFDRAGRRAAQHAVRATAAPARWFRSALPKRWGHGMGMRLARKAAAKVFGIRLTPDGKTATATVCPADLAPDGGGCALYGSGLAELLRAFTSFDGACFHSMCRATGAGECRWTTTGDEMS